MKLVICQYCNGRAELVRGSSLFQDSKEFYYCKFWRCAGCKAHVGCHPGTDKPLGTLAKQNLRRLRCIVHLAFDKRWKNGRVKKRRRKRSAAYIWLAAELGIPVEQCHVGMFDERMCERALEVLGHSNREDEIDFGFVRYEPEKKMSKLQFAVLASGSRGNAVYVQPGSGPGFLLDCGLSKSALSKRLKIIGKTIDDVAWAFMTHEHIDHWNSSCVMGIVASLGVHHVHGSRRMFLGATITPFELSHGDCPCYGFRVDYKGLSMAYLVDTKYVPEESLPYLFNLDAVIIEANYREGKVIVYPGYGRPEERHMSNEQAACTLGLINSDRLKHVVMAHGSSRNNTEAFALNAGKAGAPQAQVLVARHDQPTKMITLMN